LTAAPETLGEVTQSGHRNHATAAGSASPLVQDQQQQSLLIRSSQGLSPSKQQLQSFGKEGLAAKAAHVGVLLG
jgi:hypothetical protein